MTEIKSLPNDWMPEFGEIQPTGLTLEIFHYNSWELFQPFYFDDMLNKEQKYYVKNIEDLKGYEIMGKVYISRNSDVILRATYDKLRVRPSKA